jgi:mono/diheme cytochrome c family protein
MERKMTVSAKFLRPGTMMMVALCAVVWGATPAAPAPAPQNAAQNTPAQKKAAQPAQGSEDPGERVFEQNCSRCHAAPEGFSTRISGTIVRHMRVRASLSEKQERELMKYLNP